MRISWSLDQALDEISKGSYMQHAAREQDITHPSLHYIATRYALDRYRKALTDGCINRVIDILKQDESSTLLRAKIITQRNYARRYAPALVEQGLFRDALLAINSRACNQAGLPIGQDMPRVKRKQRAQIGVDIGVTPNEHNDESLTKQRVKP